MLCDPRRGAGGDRADGPGSHCPERGERWIEQAPHAHFARIASGVSGCAEGCALANAGSAIAVSWIRFTVGQGDRLICWLIAAVTWPTRQMSAMVGASP